MSVVALIFLILNAVTTYALVLCMFTSSIHIVSRQFLTPNQILTAGTVLNSDPLTVTVERLSNVRRSLTTSRYSIFRPRHVY